MSTEKTIKIQKNKVLTYSVNKAGFKTVYGSVLVNENQNINIELKNLNSQDEPFQLGDRLFGISSFVDYFTPSGIYDVDSLKYILATQTTGTGLTNIAVVKETWLSQVETTLGIETPKGTSNNFIFTYNGSTWDITGALTLSGQSLEDYGISFDGTAVSGDAITVVETQYNKFAFFVLDANYRGNYAWGSGKCTPVQYDSESDALNAGESATFNYDCVYPTIVDHAAFNFCKGLGIFILSSKVKIHPVMPNIKELSMIWSRRTDLDAIDPIISSGSSSYNLTNWDFERGWVNSSTEAQYGGGGTYAWFVKSDGNLSWGSGLNYSDKSQSMGIIPIFEVPVM